MELEPELSRVGAKASMVDRWTSRVRTSAWIKRRSMSGKSVNPIQATASDCVELSDSNHFPWKRNAVYSPASLTGGGV